ncbi:MAG TPA: DUF3592 domain-containing protein [Planctomycetota bacterium]|nr:DUF3592 domain-containing protein [Planctomycetota bacterium]
MSLIPPLAILAWIGAAIAGGGRDVGHCREAADLLPGGLLLVAIPLVLLRAMLDDAGVPGEWRVQPEEAVQVSAKDLAGSEFLSIPPPPRRLGACGTIASLSMLALILIVVAGIAGCAFTRSSALAGGLVLLIGSVPLVLVFRRTLLFLHLLRCGIPAIAEYRRQSTWGREPKADSPRTDSVARVFAFVADDGREYGVEVDDTDAMPPKLQRGLRQVVLYDPARPRRAICVASLPRDVRFCEDGIVRFGSPRTVVLCVTLLAGTAIAVVYMLVRLGR